MPLFCESVVARGIFQRVFLVFAMVHTLFSMAADLKSVGHFSVPGVRILCPPPFSCLYLGIPTLGRGQKRKNAGPRKASLETN